MRKREIKGNSGISSKFIDVGPAKAGNWKQLQSGDDHDAVSIVEEFAQDAMPRVGYVSSSQAMDHVLRPEV